MTMRRHQTGLTMITWIFLIAILGFVGIFGFKLIPVYMDFFTINNALTTAAKNVTVGESPVQIKSSIGNLFDVNSVNAVQDKDIGIKVDPDSKNVVLTLDYDARTNFIANIDLVVHFSRTYTAIPH